MYYRTMESHRQRTKPECRVNIMQKFRSYLTENTVRFYYDYQRLSDVHKSIRRLSLESYRKHK